jgi:hypothetical protein
VRGAYVGIIRTPAYRPRWRDDAEDLSIAFLPRRHNFYSISSRTANPAIRTPSKTNYLLHSAMNYQLKEQFAVFPKA